MLTLEDIDNIYKMVDAYFESSPELKELMDSFDEYNKWMEQHDELMKFIENNMVTTDKIIISDDGTNFGEIKLTDGPSAFGEIVLNKEGELK